MKNYFNMTDDKIKEYLNLGGKLFIVTNLQTIRDGGTIEINTTDITYYMSNDSKYFYTIYPLNESNLVTNKLEINFLISRISEYLIKQYDSLDKYHLKFTRFLDQNIN